MLWRLRNVFAPFSLVSTSMAITISSRVSVDSYSLSSCASAFSWSTSAAKYSSRICEFIATMASTMAKPAVRCLLFLGLLLPSAPPRRRLFEESTPFSVVAAGGSFSESLPPRRYRRQLWEGRHRHCQRRALLQSAHARWWHFGRQILRGVCPTEERACL
jgi:hypothetical protein